MLCLMTSCFVFSVNDVNHQVSRGRRVTHRQAPGLAGELWEGPAYEVPRSVPV